MIASEEICEKIAAKKNKYDVLFAFFWKNPKPTIKRDNAKPCLIIFVVIKTNDDVIMKKAIDNKKVRLSSVRSLYPPIIISKTSMENK